MKEFYLSSAFNPMPTLQFDYGIGTGSTGSIYQGASPSSLNQSLMELMDMSLNKKRKFSVMDRKEEDSDKPYICRFCDKCFDKSQALGGHMNCHRRERKEEEISQAVELLSKEKSGSALAETQFSSLNGCIQHNFAPKPWSANALADYIHLQPPQPDFTSMTGQILSSSHKSFSLGDHVYNNFSSVKSDACLESISSIDPCLVTDIETKKISMPMPTSMSMTGPGADHFPNVHVQIQQQQHHIDEIETACPQEVVEIETAPAGIHFKWTDHKPSFNFSGAVSQSSVYDHADQSSVNPSLRLSKIIVDIEDAIPHNQGNTASDVQVIGEEDHIPQSTSGDADADSCSVPFDFECVHV